MLALLIAAAISPSIGSIDPKAQAVLDAAKLAAGGAAVDALGPYELDERIRWQGLTGTEVTLCDPKTGAYSHRIDLGLHSGGDGFDGKHAWIKDFTGDTWEVADRSELASAERDAYLCSLAYWYPDRMPPAKIKFEGPGDLDGSAVDQVSVDLPDLDSLVLSFDHQNGRLISISSIPFAVTSSTTTFYSDFRNAAGVSLPFHRASKSTSFGSFETDGDVRSFAVDPEIPSKLAFVNATPDDSSIEGGKTSVSLPFEWSNGLIYVKVTLNGRGPYRFLLDSGRANHVSAQVASRLPLTDGFGKSIVDDRKLKSLGSRVATLAVSGASVRDQPMIVDPSALAYYYSAIDGDKVDGVLGFEFLRRFVTTLDFGTNTMTLTRASSFKADTSAHAAPFVFDGLIPRITALVDGKAGDFAINTNLSYSLVANVTWTEHNDPEQYERGLRWPGNEYFFGPRLAELVGSAKRVGVITIDGLTVPKPVIIDTTQPMGWGSFEEDTAGDIGLGLLKRFVVSLDYQKQTLWLTPTKAAATPEAFDRSGLLVAKTQAGTFEVDVIRGSPADRSKIMRGEELTAIDGKAASKWTVDSLRRYFERQPGTKIHLRVATLKSEKVIATREVIIELKDYV